MTETPNTPAVPSWAAVRIDRTRAVAEEKRKDADAAVDRQLRAAQARVQLDSERRAAALAEARERAAQRRDVVAARRAARRRRREALAALLLRTVRQARAGSAGVWSSVVYLLAVAVAAGGQVSLAVQHGLAWWAGLGVAGFVEGLALAMALTARTMRLAGERALAPRVLTWVAAVFAAAVNLYAHRGDPVEAAVFAAASIAGITLWEIRGEAKTRDQMRMAGGAIRAQRAEDLVLRDLAKATSKQARAAAKAGDTDAALAALAELEGLHARTAAARAQAAREAGRLAADPRTVPAGPGPGSGPNTSARPGSAPVGPGKGRPARPVRGRAAVGPGPADPDVSDLLAPGRTAARALAAAGQPLTRDGLVAQLRQAGVPVSTARANALKRALEAGPHPIPEPAGDDGRPADPGEVSA